MEKVKKAYYYLFYQLYKWYEKGPSVWWSEWKASLTLIVLEIWLISSLLLYYKVFLAPNADIVGSQLTWGILVLLLALIDYFIFHYNDQWKEIVLEFDELPKNKSKKGGWLVFGFVSLIALNFIFSFYLYYQT
ncbi:hypothetical protein G5B10_14410 [Fluviicola sp. SGL-29]|nr:hypothetical protein [Fluviicola sp. SGL-29]